MRILRYPLELTEYQELKVGWPARVLSVALGKGGNIDLWAACADPEERVSAESSIPIPDMPVPDDVLVPIYIVGTGKPMPEELTWPGFLGTVVMGDYVWHIWTGSQRTNTGGEWGFISKVSKG